MDRIPPVLNRGVISNWLEAKPSVSSMLTVDTLGDIGFQDIPVAEWGSIGGDLANQSDLSAYLTSLSEGLTALDTVKLNSADFTFANIGGTASDNATLVAVLSDYLPKTGGTLTGSLGGTTANFSSTVTAAAFDVPQNGSNVSQYRFSASGTDRGALVFNPVRLEIGLRNANFTTSGEHSLYVDGSGNLGFRNASVYNSSPTFTVSPAGAVVAAGTISTRNGVNATRFEVYGTYTDASNYRRLYLASNTSGAFTLGVEGLGTGASGNTLTLTTGSASLRVDTAVQAKLSGSYTLELNSSFDTAAHGVTRLTLGSGSATLSFLNTSFSAIDGSFNLGGTTSSHVGIRRSGTTLQARLGDNSDFADFAARAGTFSGNVNGSNLVASNGISGYTISSNASRCLMFNHFNVAAGLGYTFSPNSTAGNGSEEVGFYRDGTRSICVSGGANATRLNLYGTYTDASNYRRLYISSTTGGAFTLGIEGLGTGASGNTLSLGSPISGNIIFANTAGSTLGSIGIVTQAGTGVFTGTVCQGLEFRHSITGSGAGGIGINNSHVFYLRSANSAEVQIDYSIDLRPHTSHQVNVYTDNGFRVRTADNSAGAPLASGTITATAPNSTSAAAVFRAAASQSTNIVEIKNSAGSNLSYFGGNGDFFGNSFAGSVYSMSTHYSGGFALGPTAGIYFGNTTWPTSGLKASLVFDSGNHGAVASVALRYGSEAQTFRIYGTYTDSSNYRRLYISSTTAGAFTLSVEGLGTGASGNTLAVNATTVTTSPGFANSQAFGPGHSMVGTGCTLIGTSVNQSYSTSTVGIGYNVNAVGRNSVYIGNSNTAPTPGSVVANTVSIGDAVTTGTGCVAIGAQSSAAQFSTVVGYAASDNDGGVAIGRLATCTLAQPIAIGNTATATVRGIAIGYIANAGTRSIALGQNTVAFQDSIAIGNTAVTTAVGQLHFGSSAGPISMVSFPGATFNRINLGDATSANPAIKRNGTAINFRLADDSADCSIAALAGTFSGSIVANSTLDFGSATAGSARINMTSQQYTASNIAINMPWGTGTPCGIYGSNGIVGFAAASSSYFEVNTSGLRVVGNRSIGLGGTIASPEVTLFSGSNVLEQRNGASAQTLRIYNAFTDSSNYDRGFIRWLANVLEIGTEIAGTYTTTRAMVLVGQAGFSIQTNAATRFSIGTAGQTIISSTFTTATQQNSVAIAGDFLNVTGQYALGHGAIPGVGGATVAATYSVGICGGGTQSGADGSLSHGFAAISRIYSSRTFSCHRFSTNGDVQGIEVILRAKTTDATPVILYASGTNRVTVPNGKVLHLTVNITGIKSDGSAVAVYLRQVAIKNVGGTTSLVGSVNTIGVDTASGTSISIVADDTNDALEISATGIAGETWRWEAIVYGSDLTFGT